MEARPWLLVAAISLSACARQAPEKQIVDDAAAAMGGRDRILAVKTLVLEGEGRNGNLGQDMTPESSSQGFTVTGYKRTVDVAAAGRARVEQTRTPTFPYFQGQAPQKQVLGVAGDVAYNVGAAGNATRASNAVAKDRRTDIDHHPLTALRAALDSASTVKSPRTEDNHTFVDVATANGVAFSLVLDNETRLPARVVSKTDNANLGDVTIETNFADYQDVGGLKLPARLTTKIDGYTSADLHLTKQTVDGDAGDLAAPAAAVSAAPIAGPPPPTVTAEEVAKGVWWLAGQSHHSVVVEFGDHLTLIEVPLSEARSLAVIAKARELVPGKPLTQVVNTHAHFDHSSGIRAAVAEGLTVITHKGNAPYYKAAVERPHTIAPDALAKNPKPLKIETVDEEMTLKDNTRTLNLYHIAGNPHADTLLMAYLPKERILVEADAFSPAGPALPAAAAGEPYAPNLLDNVRRRGLKVERIVPIHGAIAPFDSLVKAAAR
jgi:glyoxylase-like metal-dependent hydrolase (beta-lactamase superfamily II)